MKLLLSESTQLLYLDGIEGSYLKETPIKVLEYAKGGYILDRSMMHYNGGGQPGDRGYIISGNFRIPIYDVKKKGKNVVHLSDFRADITEGVLLVDWERRYKIMKMHTLQHAISSIIFEKGYMTTNAEVFPGFGFIETDKNVEAIPEEGYNIDHTDLPVERYYVDRDDLDAQLLRRCDLERLPKSVSKISIVKIEGLDICACAGTHVRNTSEIGKYWLRYFSNRIEFGSF